MRKPIISILIFLIQLLEHLANRLKIRKFPPSAQDGMLPNRIQPCHVLEPRQGTIRRQGIRRQHHPSIVFHAQDGRPCHHGGSRAFARTRPCDSSSTSSSRARKAVVFDCDPKHVGVGAVGVNADEEEE